MAFISTSNLLKIGRVHRQVQTHVCRVPIRAENRPNPRSNPSSSEDIPETPSDKRKIRQQESFQTPESMLLADLEKMRAKRKRLMNSDTNQVSSNGITLKSAIETILLWDFFLVLGFLLWLGIALIPHFVAKNDVLLDPWLALWQPFIQPVLGVLMLGTIVQGTMSYISSQK